MKMVAVRRMLAAGMTAVLIGQGAVIPAEAQNEPVTLPDPVFSLGFESLSQSAGEAVTGGITAETGESVEVHDTVTAQEGRGGGKAVLLAWELGIKLCIFTIRQETKAISLRQIRKS